MSAITSNDRYKIIILHHNRSNQWWKHGRCADVPGTQTIDEYFTKTIHLADQYIALISK